MTTRRRLPTQPPGDGQAHANGPAPATPSTPVTAGAPRTGALARTAIAGLATTRIGLASLRHRWRGDTPVDPASPPESRAATGRQAHEAEIGRILMGAMSQLRGTALKAAQVLSLDADFLPKGVRDELAKSTHQATPLNRALVGKVFRKAFGCEPEALFQHFEPTAFAAASLGQVHRARLHDGAAVAVKIQYPGIDVTLDTDLALLRRTLRTLGRGLVALPDPAVVDRLIDDIARQLREEVDYEHEAQIQQWFQHHRPHPDIVIPEVVLSHSRRTVLTQTFLSGHHVQAWMAQSPGAGLRNRQGQALFDGLLRSALHHGRLHADLHPGNVLFMPDGRVGLLDFGCTQTVSPGFTQSLARIWTLWPQRPTSVPQLLANYQALGLAAPDLALSTFEHEVLPAVSHLLDWATEPFTGGDFNFADKRPPTTASAQQQATVSQHLRHMPAELMSWDRAWLGLMHLLHQLAPVVDTRHACECLNQWAQRPHQARS